MDILFTILSAIFGLVAFIGGIILVVAGFKRSVVWGFVNLLVPFGVVVFAVKYWEDAKLGCLMQVGAVALSFGLAMVMGATMGFGMFDEMAGMEAQMETQLRAQQEAQRGGGTLQSQSQGQSESSTAKTEPKPPKRKERRFVYQETDVDFLPGVIGRPIKLKKRDGTEQAGKLIAVEDDIIRIEKRLRGGSMELFVRKPEIESVKVLEEVQ